MEEKRRVTDGEIREEIAPACIDELREYPDGVCLTLDELIYECNYEDCDLSDTQRVLLKKRICSLAVRKKITLEWLTDGSFIVHNLDAKFVCPYCESKNTVRIVYGLPSISKLIKKTNPVHPGGCLVSEFSPDRYCNDCERSFSSEELIYASCEEEAEEPGPIEIGQKLPDDITSALSVNYRFESWNFRKLQISAVRNENGIDVFGEDEGLGEFAYRNETRHSISADEWDDLINSLYNKYNFHEWEMNYSDPKWLDGVSWEISVCFPDNRIQMRSGQNACPDCWAQVNGLFHSLLR